MSTFSQLTDQVLAKLRSFVRDQELTTHLTQPLAEDGLVLTVDDTTVLSRGRVEIGDEIIYLTRVDRQGSTATIPPYGRGYDSTTAAAHLVGERVVMTPLFPRHYVKHEINQIIKEVGAALYGVQKLEFDSGEYVYELPATTSHVIDVSATWTLHPAGSQRIRRWSVDHNSPTSLSATGKALHISEFIAKSDAVKIVVTVAVEPVPLAGDADFSTTLLPETSESVIVLLTAARLLATADSHEIQSRAVEANALDSKAQSGRAANQSKYLLALGQQRLSEERQRLLDSTPTYSHYNR